MPGSSETGILTSIRNPRVQRARRLLRKTQRSEENAFLVEGPRAIEDALRADAAIQEVFVDEAHAASEVIDVARNRGIAVHVTGRGVIEAISDSATPQGIVAVATSPLRDLEDVTLSRGLVVVSAGIADPGNLGTLVRTAAAAGADALIATKGSVDVLNPKVVRGAAAALFSIPIVQGVALEDAVGFLRDRGVTVLGTAATDGIAIYDADLTRPLAFVLGNESWGLPADQVALLDGTVMIPMPGSVESLNVASAGAIIAFETLRQRRSPA